MTELLDKIMGSVDKYITAAGVVAGEFAETAKIKADMYGIKKKRDQTFIEIGEAVYKMYLKGSFDMNRVSEKCKHASRLDEQMKEKEHEAKDVHRSSKNHHRKKHRKHYKEPEKEQQNMEQENAKQEKMEQQDNNAQAESSHGTDTE
jgi:hypothetical protein